MFVIFIGPPGCGKGTQSEKLKEKGFIHISTGDLLRQEVKKETPLGLEFQSILAKGQLVPDELILKIVQKKLDSIEHSKILFDGFPRTIPQAEALEKMLTEKKHSLDLVVNFSISDDLLVDRIVGRVICSDCGATFNKKLNPPKKSGVCDYCGSTALKTRSDDKEGTLKERLKTYRKQTAPLIHHYETKGMLKIVDATLSPDEVANQLTRFL